MNIEGEELKREQKLQTSIYERLCSLREINDYYYFWWADGRSVGKKQYYEKKQEMLKLLKEILSFLEE